MFDWRLLMLSRLGKSPTLDEIARSTPPIASVRGDVSRPFWSIMIPSYNRLEYLRRALQTVIGQDKGPDHMQIEVVDNCSTTPGIPELVEELGRGRVAFWRNPSNLGMVGNWNTCLDRSRGRWVHLLHDDDLLLPGFYDEYERQIRSNPEAVMICGQVVVVDENDDRHGTCGPTPPPGSNRLQGFVDEQAVRQLGQFAGIVVRRDAYEQAGGFCTQFSHVADWDMWFRIGRLGPVIGTHEPYGAYRVHSGSDTSRLMISATNIRESCHVIQTNLARLGLNQTIARADWRKRLAEFAETTAWRLDERGSLEGRLNQHCWAWRLAPTFSRLRMVARSWLKLRMGNVLKKKLILGSQQG